MNLSDFDFDLPEGLIATRPARPRTSARLLLAEGDRISDRHVHDLTDIFRPGDRLVLNNTRVLPARLFGTRQRGDAVAKVEITLLEPRATGWRALARPLRKVQVGEVIRSMQPTKPLVDAVTLMFRNAWTIRTAQMEQAVVAAKQKVREADTQINAIATSSPTMRFPIAPPPHQPQRNCCRGQLVSSPQPPGQRYDCYL